METRLRINREWQRHEAAELTVIQAMTETKLASSLQQIGNHIEVQRRTYERVHMEMLYAKGALYLAQRRLEQARHWHQSAFTELHLLETSVESMHERLAPVDA